MTYGKNTMFKGLAISLFVITFGMVVAPILAISLTDQGRATCHLNYITPCWD